jgi:hypothetical protein
LVTVVGVFPQIIRLVVAVRVPLAGQVLAQAGILRALAALVNQSALKLRPHPSIMLAAAAAGT